jgi:hypothetical protein
MMLFNVSSAIALIGFVIVIRLGWRVLRFWRQVREEALLHVSLMFFYTGALIIMLIILAASVFWISPRHILYSDFVFTFGAFYDFFYLEFSLFYLALFSNSRRFIEKYIPLLIGGALTLNLVLPFVPSDNLNVLTLVLHGIAILAGLSLFLQLYIRIKSNEVYFSPEEREFIRLIKQIVFGLFAVSLPDGLGFLMLSFVSIEVTEGFYLLFAIIITVSSTVVFYLFNLLAKKGKKVDFAHFFNTLS